MRNLDRPVQELKEIKDKIDNAEERLRQLKNQEKKILKQDIVKRIKERTHKKPGHFFSVLVCLNFQILPLRPSSNRRLLLRKDPHFLLGFLLIHIPDRYKFYPYS